MEVRNGFARIWAIIEYEAEPGLGQAELTSHLGGFEQEVTEQLMIIGFSFGDSRDGFLRDDQDMRGSLRFDVLESQDQVILINDGGRDFARDDFLEECGHNAWGLVSGE